MMNIVWRARAAIIGLIAGSIPLAAALDLYVSWHSDNALLRSQAFSITEKLSSDSERIVAINEWVYHNQGFGKNKQYFVLPNLGPTPIQVLKSGGDCADKSRLVAAMLNELGIQAGLVMIFPCTTCAPIHTVVEARYEKGRMVVDPIWNINYPTGDGRYFGVSDLAGTDRGRRQLTQLQKERGPTDKRIQVMPTTEATFDFAKSINWQKIPTIYTIIKNLGYSPEDLFRPRVLEDPKLAIVIILLVGASGCVVAGILGNIIILYIAKSKTDCLNKPRFSA
jgi:Transglutaminase-like superfamily